MNNKTNILDRFKKEVEFLSKLEFRDFIIKKWIYYNLLYKICKIRCDLTLKIKNINLIIPNSPQAFGVIEEVFIEEVYCQLNGLNCLLDIGAFLGESSVYLINNNNQKVIAVEPDPDHYKYLIKNVRNYNIDSYNLAISTQKQKLKFFKNYDFDLGTNYKNFFMKKQRTFEVESIPISELLSKCPDGIKMDIEGGEFEIIQWFLNNPERFPFKKGYIEIHFDGKNDHNINIFKNFVSFLRDRDFNYNIYMGSKIISLTQLLRFYDTLKDDLWLIFHIFFDKRKQ